MNKKDATLAFYVLINRLYSINYSSLRVSEQQKAKAMSEEFRFKMPFEQTESWLDAKMIDLSSMRNTFFENYNEANVENVEYFDIIDKELEKSKEALMLMHNIWFEQNGSFEDIFDGFLCKSPKLLELICIFEMQPFMTNDKAVMNIVDTYSTYIVNLFYKTITHSMIDIVQQLGNDFNSNCTPSLYRGIIGNNNIVMLSAEKLKEIRKGVEETHKKIKAIKTKKHSGKAYTQNMAENKYLELDVFVGQLEQRLKSANTDIFNDVKSRIVEGTIDFLTGSGSIERPVVNEIYATKLELNYIEYLREMMDYALAVVSESSKTDKKEKGQTE